jgi:hypothetical protein
MHSEALMKIWLSSIEFYVTIISSILLLYLALMLVEREVDLSDSLRFASYLGLTIVWANMVALLVYYRRLINILSETINEVTRLSKD